MCQERLDPIKPFLSSPQRARCADTLCAALATGLEKRKEVRSGRVAEHPNYSSPPRHPETARLARYPPRMRTSHNVPTAVVSSATGAPTFK